jgi:hypothetical protein
VLAGATVQFHRLSAALADPESMASTVETAMVERARFIMET